MAYRVNDTKRQERMMQWIVKKRSSTQSQSFLKRLIGWTFGPYFIQAETLGGRWD